MDSGLNLGFDPATDTGTGISIDSDLGFGEVVGSGLASGTAMGFGVVWGFGLCSGAAMSFGLFSGLDIELVLTLKVLTLKCSHLKFSTSYTSALPGSFL